MRKHNQRKLIGRDCLAYVIYQGKVVVSEKTNVFETTETTLTVRNEQNNEITTVIPSGFVRERKIEITTGVFRDGKFVPNPIQTRDK